MVYLSSGDSFCQAVANFNGIKSVTGLASLGFVSEGLVSQYAHVCCTVSLSRIQELLSNKSWTFSVALDMSNHQYTGYLDIRVRIMIGDELKNLHVVALPIEGTHSAS